MWSWFQIGIFLLMITIIFVMVAYAFAQNYKVTQIDSKIQGDDRIEPDVVIEDSSSSSSSSSIEKEEDDEEQGENDEETLNTGYLSD
jgi:hypothetical protein